MNAVANSAPHASSGAAPLLVVSCDRYADVWPHFFGLLRRHWPDCPFPVVLGTNHLAPSFPGVTVAPIGPDRSWSSNASRMLDAVVASHPHADYVLLLLEDFFLTGAVDSGRLMELLATARRTQAGCLRLAAGLPLALPPTHPAPHLQGLGVVAPGDEYRITLQASFWRIDFLRRLLAPGLSPWEFEALGTQQSELLDDTVLAVTDPAIDYDHAIEKGKWKPQGLAILRAAGLEPGSLLREVYGAEELARQLDERRAQGLSSRHRALALHSFLAGRRRQGLKYLFAAEGGARSRIADLPLAACGLCGAALTRQCLGLYLRLRLGMRARQERRNV